MDMGNRIVKTWGWRKGWEEVGDDLEEYSTTMSIKSQWLFLCLELL